MLILNVDRISLQFLSHTLSGLFLGPIWAVATAVVGDILGMLINSAGATFTFGLTLSAAVRGLIYGLMLYKKPIKYWRTFLAVSVVTVVVDIGLNPIWMSMLYGNGYVATLLVKLPIRAVFIPIAATVLYFVAKGVTRAVKVPSKK